MDMVRWKCCTNHAERVQHGYVQALTMGAWGDKNLQLFPPWARVEVYPPLLIELSSQAPGFYLDKDIPISVLQEYNVVRWLYNWRSW